MTTVILAPGTQVGLAGTADLLATSTTHACARLVTGQVQCWGSNYQGALGTDPQTMNSDVPITVPAVNGPALLAAGWYHNCFASQQGSVSCWGYNVSGQLGDGTTMSRATTGTPLLVGGQPTVALAGGGEHTCAVLATGAVHCWGRNAEAQLGIGPAGAPRTTPQPVNVGGPAIGISAGAIHTCALLQNGDVVCWGNNASGEVGDGTFGMRTTPGPRVALAGPAVAVACGDTHTCALLASGAVQCWGDNMFGQLGNGGTPAESPTPVTVVGIP